MNDTPQVDAQGPADITVNDDWCIKLPNEYAYSTLQNDAEHKILVFHSDDNTEIWEIYQFDEDFPKCNNLLDDKIRNEVIRKKVLNGSGVHGEKKFEFVLRQESDICVYCQLIEGGGDPGENGDHYDWVSFYLEVVTLKAKYDLDVVISSPSFQDDFQDRLNRIANSICLKEEGRAPDYTRKFMTLNRKLPITTPSKPEVLGACSEWIKVQKSLAKLDIATATITKYSLLAVKDVPTNAFELSEKAWEMSENFRVSNLLKGSYDRAMEIQNGVMYDIEPIHKLRTFAWLVGEYCKQRGSSPNTLDRNVVLALGQLAGSRVASYDENHYPAICSYPDNHTVYIPDGENGSHSDKIFDVIASLPNDNAQWYIADLNTLRDELSGLYHCMLAIETYLQDRRKDDSIQLCGDHADILYAWCTLAIASNYAFAIMSCEECKSDGHYRRHTFREFTSGSVMPELLDYEVCVDKVYLRESSNRLILGANAYSLAIPKGIICSPETDDTYASLDGFSKDTDGNGLQLLISKLNPIEGTLREYLQQSVDDSEGNGYYMMLHEEDNVEVGVFIQVSTIFIKMTCNICLVIRIDGIAYKFQAKYGCQGFALGTGLSNQIKEFTSIFDDILITRSGKHIHCEVDNDVLKKIIDSVFGIDREEDSKKGEHCTVDTPAIVNDDWVITVPAGYMYSTDTKLVGHRPIVLGLDDGTLNFSSPFDSTINFSVTMPLKGTPMPDLPLSNPAMYQYVSAAQMWSNECIRKNDEVGVYGSVGNIEPNEDGGTLCISRGGIVTRHGVYIFQMFDSQATTKLEAKTTMLRLLKSIKSKEEL